MSEGELRERLAQLMCTFAYKAERMSLAEIVGDVRVDEIDTRRPRVDMILAEITAAGYRIEKIPPNCEDLMPRCVEECVKNGNTEDWCESTCEASSMFWDCEWPVEEAERLDDGGEA